MIVIFQNNQIIAVDKKLLQTLNCSLQDLSNKISQIDLALNSIKNNEIIIENKTFNVKELEVISIDNLFVYELKPESLKTSLEELVPEIKPIEQTNSEEISLKKDIFSTDIKSLTSEEQNKTSLENFEIKPIEESTIPENKEIQTITSLESFETDKTPLKDTSFEIEASTSLEETTEPQEISITFDDEFEEIENILSLNDEKAKKLILEDLHQASVDFEMDLESIKELYNDLINQIQTNEKNFYKAIKEKNYEEMHKIAHSLKGASLNLRVSNLALILKTIDEKSKEKISFNKLEFLVNSFYNFVNKVTTLELENTSSTINQIPTFLKELILETIKNYTETQNEKKLKKDLKYIEKLLNIKINSIEELQNIVKAIK